MHFELVLYLICSFIKLNYLNKTFVSYLFYICSFRCPIELSWCTYLMELSNFYCISRVPQKPLKSMHIFSFLVSRGNLRSNRIFISNSLFLSSLPTPTNFVSFFFTADLFIANVLFCFFQW